VCVCVCVWSEQGSPVLRVITVKVHNFFHFAPTVFQVLQVHISVALLILTSVQ